MEFNNILDQLPFGPEFLFVDKLHQVDDDGAVGEYTFLKHLYFYKGHFKDGPVTPGVILTECCAQIGLVCLGLHLLNVSDTSILKIGLSSTEMQFLLPVFPNEKVVVTSKKIYFRFNKLKCDVRMHNSKGELVCKGIMAGMIKMEEA
ncbi:hydroxymyristoyl-ACP dehydratase [Sediminicola sp. YIK13]|uniref:3-hydroxyacyl-ACP dehydratase FabZ family protein n=1 Tax=Sediminicola sp. YIK13 TaxID=1453352 RepID=UPI00071FEDB5|nr:hydroxymyristoyl-ACP dehydratase [Sediminicola sp. YIK13]ALM07020.1 hydroxymyristoyl-ACP dehydratase [Sediminicola sp. YIK13]